MIRAHSWLLAIPLALASAFTPFTVQAQDAVDKAAVDLLVGNTLVTRLMDSSVPSQEGRLLLRADGTAVWVNIEPDAPPVEVKWHVNDRGWLCMSGFPDETVADSCAGMTVTGNKVVMNDEASDSSGILDITLVPGNPGNL